jgi:hypothetical protein
LAFASGLACAQTLPFEPRHEAGQSITGAFEGWFKNPDGSYSLLLGYYNRNQKQEIDIPIGPTTGLNQGGPDRGQQPTSCREDGGACSPLECPPTLGTTRSPGHSSPTAQSMVIPASLKPDYEVSPLIEAAVGNTPPILKLEEGARPQGPQGLSAERGTKVGTPLTLTAWVSDDAKWTTNSGARPRNPGAPVTLRWSKYRGPGEVTFDRASPEVEKQNRKTRPPSAEKRLRWSLSASPGEYLLHVVANDYSGDGGGGFSAVGLTARLRSWCNPDPPN